MTSILRYALEKSISQFISPSLPPQDRSSVIDVNTQSDDLSSIPKELDGFKPQYAIPIKKPRNDLQAQKLYNAIRTVAFYLDSIPSLGSKLPFGVGVDSILGLIPGIGDWIGLILGIYQIFLCTLFGLPFQLLSLMLLNVILDCFLGIIPIIGDLLDFAFKSNLRNLTLLESYLLENQGNCSHGSFSILIPPSDKFIPKPLSDSDSNCNRFGKSWWKFGNSDRNEVPSIRNQVHKGRRTRPLNSGSIPSNLSFSPNSQPSRPVPSINSNLNRNDPSRNRFTELDPQDETTSQGLRSRTVPGGMDFRSGACPDAPINSSLTPNPSNPNLVMRMALPQGSKTAPIMSKDGILLPSGTESNLSEIQEPRSVDFEESSEEIKPFRLHDNSFPKSDVASTSTSVKKINILHDGFNLPRSNSSIVDESTPILPSVTGSRRGVSWYESSIAGSSNSLSKSRGKRKEVSDQENDWNDFQNRSEDVLGGEIINERNTSNTSVYKQHEINSISSSKAGRSLIIIYLAIFCVSYTTSLDSSTSYLYLNFACSEYQSLASFSTISIVQQMVFALFKPGIAKFSDVLGRFIAFLVSLTFYSIGYLLVSFSNSLNSLLIGMIVQSFGFTGIQTLISIIIADTASPRWRGLVLSVVNLPYLINFVISGILVDLVMNSNRNDRMKDWNGWRLGFRIWSIIIPISALPLLFTLYIGEKKAKQMGLICREFISDDHDDDDRISSKRSWKWIVKRWFDELDVLGLILLSTGVGSILLPITLAGRREEKGFLSLPLTPFGILSLILFLIWESQAKYPVMPYRFFKNRAVVCSCFIGLVDFASFSLSWTFLSSFIQVVKGWEQRRTGYFAMTQNVSSTLIGVLAGSIMASTQRFKTLLFVGVVIRLIGVGLMIQYRTGQDTAAQILCQVLQGMGGGFIAITMQIAVQVSVRQSDVATVTAFELLTTEIGAAVGSAMAGSFFSNRLPQKLKENLPYLSAEELSKIYGSLEIALSYPLGSDIRQKIIQSWVSLMHILCVSATLILIPALYFAILIPDSTLHDLRRQRSSGSLNHSSSLGSKNSIRSKHSRSRSRSRLRTSEIFDSSVIDANAPSLDSSNDQNNLPSSKFENSSISPKSERKPLPPFV